MFGGLKVACKLSNNAKIKTYLKILAKAENSIDIL